MLLWVSALGCSVDRVSREEFACRAGGLCTIERDASPADVFLPDVSIEREADAGFLDATSTNSRPRAATLRANCFSNNDCLILLEGSDSDSDALTFEIANEPRDGVVRADPIAADRWIYHSDEGFGGIDNFTYRAFDGIDRSAPATVFVTVVNPPDDWWDPSWSRRRRIEVDYSGATLTDFPILIRLDSSRINFRRTQPDGSDVVFVDVATGALLERELVSWSLDNEASFWVRLPLLRGPVNNTELDMYYGSTGPSVAQSSSVWSAYQSVWHFDGTTTAATGTLPLRDGNVSWSDGPIDLALGLDAKTELVLPSESLTFDSMTVSMWARVRENFGGFAALFYSTSTAAGDRDGFGPEPELHVHLDRSQRLSLFAGTGTITAAGSEASSSLDDGDWHHVAAVWSPGSALLYVDGIEVEDELIDVPIFPLSEGIFLGRTAGGAGIFTGDLDEVRLSSEVRTPSWIAAEHRTVAAPDFLQFGSEQDGR